MAVAAAAAAAAASGLFVRSYFRWIGVVALLLLLNPSRTGSTFTTSAFVVVPVSPLTYKSTSSGGVRSSSSISSSSSRMSLPQQVCTKQTGSRMRIMARCFWFSPDHVHRHTAAQPSLFFASRRYTSSFSSKASSSTTTALSMSSSVRRIGIFGGGTVGGGIVELLQRKAEYISALTLGQTRLEIVKICVRNADKERDFAIPDGCVITTQYDDILKDESIDMVVEVMGGTTDARDIVFQSLRAGKDVVTANKALIAAHLPEIEKLLAQVNIDPEKKSVQFRYEAAVCGGIPIIRSLQSDYVGDEITRMTGIINGCTNFMLTSMDKGGKSYDDALAEASALGYAEADPTLDVGGFDARSKLRILMRLGLGMEVAEEEISCRGITDLTKLDFSYAKMMGGTIKLVGVATTTSDPDKIAAFVSPCYVTFADALASVNYATNAIEVKSKNMGATTYVGPGAGRYPTANSCVNDIVALAKGDQTPLPFLPAAPDKKFVNNYDSVFYIRLKYRDGLGITRQCGEICEKHGVSIHSILQNPITQFTDAAFVLITEKVSLSSVKKVCTDLEELEWCRGPAFYMPVLREDWVTAMAPP